MNFLPFFFAISIIIPVFAGSSGTYDPIPILYYPVQNIYRISSLPMLEKMLSHTAVNKPTFSHVLFLCGDNTSTTSYPYSNFQKILPSMDPNQNVLDQIPRCTKKSNMDKISTQKVPGPYNTAIGYRIRNDALDSVRESNLPSEPLQIDFWVGIPIFYKFDLVPYDTMHHFNAYNRSFISSTTCEEYHSIIVDEKETTNNLNKEIQKWFDEQRQQDEVFNKFNIPFNDNIRKELPADELQPKEYFIPHRMVPTDDFIYDDERMATCHSSNIVPIWKSISEGPIKKVEEFIQTLADNLYDHTLTVHTLMYEQLEWINDFKIKGTNVSQNVQYTISRKLVYLGSEYSYLRVPKYFLKIVGYSLPFTTIDYVNNRPQYYMVIVIHNDVFAMTSRICNKKNEPICKQNGWDVTSDEDNDQVIYCCHVTSKNLKKILEDHKFSGEVFNLNEIVISNQDTNETVKDDLRNETEDIEKNQHSKKSKRRSRLASFSRNKGDE